MSVLIAIPIAARLIQVLKDFLTAELALIDTEADDTIVTPPIPVGNFHETVLDPVPGTPAILMSVLATELIDRRVLQMGGTSDAQTRVDVVVVTSIADAGEDALAIQQFTLRYMVGIYRVLAIKHARLDTTGDPNAFVENTVLAGPMDPGPAPGQEPGQMVRTAVVPLNIRTREIL